MAAITRAFFKFIFFLLATYIAVIGVLATIVIITGCTPTPPKPESKCKTLPTTLSRAGRGWADSFVLPTQGKLYGESHLATTEDTFSGRAFPNTNVELIEKHTARSCAALSGDCAKTYLPRWSREWTPPEGGKAGQGSVGEVKPSPEQEMWTANFMWAPGTKPFPGEKWLVGINGKYIVVSVGFETGPGDKSILGGLQREGHYYLGTDNDSPIGVFGKLIDQSVAYGPINCEGFIK